MSGVTLELIGELLRSIQAEQRALRTRLDLLERRGERTASHDDLRDLAEVVTAELGRLAERIEARLDQTERSVHERLDFAALDSGSALRAVRNDA